MKKFAILPVFLFVLIVSCSKMAQEPGGGIPDLSENLSSMPVEPNGMPFQRTCATNEVFQQQLRDNPGLARKMEEIEALTRKFSSDISTYRFVNGVYEIPVHVNVLYNTSAENISDAQIQSQIDVLNKDFEATNNDYNTTSYFNNVKSGDTKIKFTWTAGSDNTTREKTSTTSWSTNNYMKFSANGGINATSPSTKLNIWVCNLSNNILGYAQFPGGNSSTDGIVIDNNAFGTGSNYALFSNFNLGRTATHEVGHWLNLRHIWGDRTCGSDNVNDTPIHNTSNYGCPSLPHYSTCKGKPLEMTMNYMDYTDDRCMYMFSAGQKTRMLATFASGGPRNSFAQP
jgi:hypothetical protein